MLTYDRLKEVLSYDPETGIFRWLKPLSTNIPVGTEAGGLDCQGYRRIGIDSRVYQAHRLAWFYMTGDWPERDLDHRDLDKSNNRFSNLRECTGSQNNANKRTWGAGGFKGVTWHKKAARWQAAISVGGKWHYLGLFDDPVAANAAYATAAKRYFGEFARAS